MASTNTFSWSEAAEKDLKDLVSVHSGKNGTRWSSVGLQFKAKYPCFEGTDNALKMKHRRMKTESVVEQSRFTWDDEAKKDLRELVDTLKLSDKLNWQNVLKEFKKMRPKFSGTAKSLNNQYLRMVASSDVTNTVKASIEFTWSNQANFELTRLTNLICVDDYPNWTKIYYTFKKLYPNYNGNKSCIQEQYKKISKALSSSPIDTETWDHNMDLILGQAISHAQNIRAAQTRDGRKKVVDPLPRLCTKIFREKYKKIHGIDYLGADMFVLKNYYRLMQNDNLSTCISKEDIDSFTNLNQKQLLAFASKNNTVTFSKVLAECCHHCGTIFPRNNDVSKKLLSAPIDNFVRIASNFVSKKALTLRYEIDEKYLTCNDCVRNPRWINDYSVTSLLTLPQELENLNEYEQNQIALCGGFCSIYQRQNSNRRIFEHRQGECNIGKKRDQDYFSIFTTFFNIERPHQFASSNEKIKAALRWLRQHNHLFKLFLSNYETLFGYLMSHHKTRPEEKIIQISKGRLEDMVGKDVSGILIPAENVKIESTVSPVFQKFGIQHPMQKKLDELRSIISVNYGDPDLEAKRWPHLFPDGTGSWRKNSSLKPQNYVKKCLLGLDGRFRKNKEFMFFWYDRLIKQRLSYFNNRQRTVNVADLVNPLRVLDIKDQNNKYGSVVPSTIPGSKTYWRARTSDLLALVRDLGTPNLFVTLTQNDNWPELQVACGHLSASELASLDQPIMQPAIGGQPVVNHPIETVVAFFKRLEMFMKACIHNKNGPFGEVLDHWYRIEYQNRGALHCHMVLWTCDETLPSDVVSAEMPRYSGSDNEILRHTFMAREYVKTFQMHVCKFGQCVRDSSHATCKYGFPYSVQLDEGLNESKMGYSYVRRCEEDKNVVPYNMCALLAWNGHINVQKVTPNGIEAYLCKYISKPEKSIEVRESCSDADRFIRSRVVGILECGSHLLQFKQVQCTRKTLFLPCDFKPNQKMLKRKIHLPSDDESDDIYYDSLLQKYLCRPKELENFTYVDLFRFYDVVSSKATYTYTQSDPVVSTDTESEVDVTHKLDESQHDYRGRVKKIQSQRMKYFSSGLQFVERGRAAIPRWRFIVPFGNESEKYYEQHLLLNVPITLEDLDENGYPFSSDNVSKTFVEECCLRGLVNSEETAKAALLGAIQRGFSVDRVIEIATTLVDQSYVAQEHVDSIIVPWVETMPETETQELKCDSNEHGEELERMVEMRMRFEPYDTYVNTMTESRKQVMEWVERKLSKNDQILAMLSGGAGVGKSYITKALYSYFVEKKMMCILLATTGSAAYLISGTTVHYYLKMDIDGNNYLQPGTMSSKIIEDTKVILLDEFSMLQHDMLNQLDDTLRRFGTSPRSYFGGKHVFLIGDPLQIPAVGNPVFTNPKLGVFSILLLKEMVRQSDTEFASLLNRVRINEMTDLDKVKLSERYVHVSEIELVDDVLIVTATRNKMDFYNRKLIQKVAGDKITIFADDFERDTNKKVSIHTKAKIRKFAKNLWGEELVLKEGCIVRLLRNLDVTTGWVNSKRARVLRVPPDGSYVVLQDLEEPSKQLPLTKMRHPFHIGADLYYRCQFPLKLGYATTVHSVQGTTVTGKYYVDLDRSFWESGQAFVALSRPKEISQLHLLNTHFEKVFVDPYYKNLLRWMVEVDELALLKKPRVIGDFPLLRIVETNKETSVFPPPSSSQVKEKLDPKLQRQFKMPRKSKLAKSKEALTKTLGNQNLETSSLPSLNTGVYRACDNFMKVFKDSSLTSNKLRFGIKFANLLLNEVNSNLGIQNVVDPLVIANPNPEVFQRWDRDVEKTRNLFAKYCTQFECELLSLSNLVKSLEISFYNCQTKYAQVSEIVRGGDLFIPVATLGDGRCFYHSVSYNLIGNSNLADTLKILLAFDICKHADVYDDIFSRIASSSANVLLKSLSYNCWADMEITFGMSLFLQRPITIVSQFEGVLGIPDNCYNPTESRDASIMIGHVSMSKDLETPNHFIALLKSLPQDGEETTFLNTQHTSLSEIELPVSDVEMRSNENSDEDL